MAWRMLHDPPYKQQRLDACQVTVIQRVDHSVNQ